MTTTLTVDDRELVEDMAKAIFDAFCSGVHSPMAREQYARQQRYKEAARAALQTPRLQSLLSDRDKLREVLRELIVSPSPDAFRNARAALTQTEVP